MEISFSQMQTWKRCRRAWAYDKVDKRKGIPGMAAIRGTRYHEAIEQVVNGEREATNPILDNAMSVFPDLGFDDIEPEEYMEEIRGEHKLRGYADIVGKIYDPNPKEGKPSEYVTVLDWKFPGKSPGGNPRQNYIDQIQLYSYLLGADTAILAFPEYNKMFTYEADLKRGQKVADECFDVAEEIVSSGALEIKGKDQQATPNYLCGKHCNHRDVCPLGGTK